MKTALGKEIARSRNKMFRFHIRGYVDLPAGACEGEDGGPDSVAEVYKILASFDRISEWLIDWGMEEPDEQIGFYVEVEEVKG